MKLNLHVSETIQGRFDVQRVNLMLVFQVNCPGCLIHALPLLEQLSDSYLDLNAFALSTAFEDFTLNTAANTGQLVESGVLTQASKRHYSRLGQHSLPYKINTTVVMDSLTSDEHIRALTESVINNMETKAPLSPQIKQEVKNQLSQRIIPTAKTGRTFLNNRMQGTPSWYLFDQDLEILDHWFGHKELAWVKSVIERYL